MRSPGPHQTKGEGEAKGTVKFARSNLSFTDMLTLLEVRPYCRCVADLKASGGDKHFGDLLEAQHAELEFVLYARVDEHIHERLAHVVTPVVHTGSVAQKILPQNGMIPSKSKNSDRNYYDK